MASAPREFESIGTTKINSISNTTKTTAKIKKRRETGWRASTAVVKPHSRGEIVSRLAGLSFDNITPSARKTTHKTLARSTNTVHINILN